jgi:hypothetical protein
MGKGTEQAQRHAGGSYGCVATAAGSDKTRGMVYVEETSASHVSHH